MKHGTPMIGQRENKSSMQTISDWAIARAAICQRSRLETALLQDTQHLASVSCFQDVRIPSPLHIVPCKVNEAGKEQVTSQCSSLDILTSAECLFRLFGLLMANFSARFDLWTHIPPKILSYITFPHPVPPSPTQHLFAQRLDCRSFPSPLSRRSEAAFVIGEQ